jgi:hypothetical protein
MSERAERRSSQEPEKSSRFPSDLNDPYSLWAGLPSGGLLPYSQVLLGFTSWLCGHYRPMWKEQSSHLTAWHLDRWSGLYGWCLAEATGRLRERYQEMYSDADFMVLHLGEELMSGKPDTIKSRFWTPLFIQRQLTGDIAFFEYIARTLQRKNDLVHGQRRLLAILFDRGFVPFEYWTSAAISDFWRLHINVNAPSPGLIRRWLGLMNLGLAYPPIVAGFGPKGITRFDAAAARLHGLPIS